MSSVWRTMLAGLALAAGAVAVADADDVVAVVNGQALSRADFGRVLVQALGPSALDTLVDWKLLEQEARRRGVTASAAELAERKELEIALRVRAVAQNCRMGLAEYLRSTGRSADDLRREVAAGVSDNVIRVLLLAEKLLAGEMDLSDAALRAYHERTRGPSFTAAHIVVAGRRRAEELLELLRGEPALWERAVLAYSLDRASVPYKGRIGPVPAASELGRTLAAMKPGELALYREGELWHVLRLAEVIPASGQPFEEVKGALKAELAAVELPGRFELLLAGLNRDACVAVNLFASPGSRALLGEDAAVFVNGEAVSVSRLADVLVDEFGGAMIEPYVEQALILQEARRRGLEVSEGELAARAQVIGDQLFQEQAAQREVTPRRLAELLAEAGVSVADYKRDLARQLVSADDVRATVLAERMVADGVEVTDAQIAQAYEDLRKDRFVVKELSVESAAAAERIYRQVREGMSFDVVGRTEIPEPGVWLSGGLIEVVTSSHPAYPYVSYLREGEVSSVFKSGGRYRIMKVLERHPASEPPPLDVVRSTLAEQVRLQQSRARIRALLVKLKAESDIEIRLD